MALLVFAMVFFIFLNHLLTRQGPLTPAFEARMYMGIGMVQELKGFNLSRVLFHVGQLSHIILSKLYRIPRTMGLL